MSETDESSLWVEHEWRDAILAELHARPFLPLQVPRRIYHFAFATNHQEAEADRAAIEALARVAGVEPPASGANFHYFVLGDWRLRWEQHTEFTTYSWSTGIDAATPFHDLNPLATGEVAFRPPGRVIVAAHLCVIDRNLPLEKLAGYFNPHSLCVVGVGKGCANMLTDFAVDGYGFTRFAIRVLDATPIEAGRLAQRLLEIETYRSMALLGLPLARQVTPQLQAMEQELVNITHALSLDHDWRVNHDLLHRLSELLARSEALSTRTGFRFGAGRAYYALVKNRIDLLQETKEGQFATISNFLSARLEPAIETCNAAEARQARFSTDVERAANLMRTGITLDMERQNGALLDDMNRRTRLQMRLNRMVQGISIAALSYYLVGLFGYLAKGLKDSGHLPGGLTAELATAIALPFAVLFSWAFMMRVQILSRRAAEEEKVD